MVAMTSDSWGGLGPAAVVTSVVNYKEGITLIRCDLNLSVRDADMKDDLPRSLRDRVGG